MPARASSPPAPRPANGERRAPAGARRHVGGSFGSRFQTKGEADDRIDGSQAVESEGRRAAVVGGRDRRVGGGDRAGPGGLGADRLRGGAGAARRSARASRSGRTGCGRCASWAWASWSRRRRGPAGPCAAADGSVLARVRPGGDRGAATGRRWSALHRADLQRGAARRELGAERLRHRVALTAAGRGRASLRRRLSVAHADLIVGADGIGSTVRAALLGDGEPRDSGLVAFRGVAAHDGRGAGGGVVGTGQRRRAAGPRRAGASTGTSRTAASPTAGRCRRCSPSTPRHSADRRLHPGGGGPRPPPLRPRPGRGLEPGRGDAARRRRPPDAAVPRPGRLLGARGRRRPGRGDGGGGRRRSSAASLRAGAGEADGGAGRGSRKAAKAALLGSATGRRLRNALVARAPESTRLRQLDPHLRAA